MITVIVPEWVLWVAIAMVSVSLALTAVHAVVRVMLLRSQEELNKSTASLVDTLGGS